VGLAGGLNPYFVRCFMSDAEASAVFQTNNEQRIVEVININPEKIIDENGKKIDLKNTRALTDWLKKQYQGMEIKISDDGLQLTITREGLEASAKRRGKQQRQMYAELVRLIETAVFDTYELSDYDETTGENEKHAKIEKQNIYYSAARIGKKYYSVCIKIDIPINKAYPNYYKDHKITEIKIEPSLTSYGSQLYQGQSVAGGPLQDEGSITRISLAVLKGDVKPSHIESSP
jgi:hypothetical protein